MQKVNLKRLARLNFGCLWSTYLIQRIAMSWGFSVRQQQCWLLPSALFEISDARLGQIHRRCYDQSEHRTRISRALALS